MWLCVLVKKRKAREFKPGRGMENWPTTKAEICK